MADAETTVFTPIDQILDDLRAGKFIILVDDPDRENEGDLVCAAEHITADKVNFMLRFGRGTLCVPLSRSRCEQLQFTPQVVQNTTRYGTAFTVAVDAAPRFGTTTGVSAHDRAVTIRRTIDEAARPEDFVRPGHVNPLIARDGGVLVRAGQTEGSVDLCRLAGLMPAAAIIEILNDDGTMARLPDLERFSHEHDIRICTIADLIEYRMQRERLVERLAAAPIRNEFGTWQIIAYGSKAERGTHLALCYGDIGQPEAAAAAPPEASTTAPQASTPAKPDALPRQPIDEPVLIRVHSECLTGDVFGSMRCECGEQLRAAMARIAEEGRGVLVYLRQEGRGVGLVNKLKAYSLQDQGMDTVEANHALGLPTDRRDYGVGAQILRDLGITHVRILTNNPKKVSRLSVYGLEVVEQLPIEIRPNAINRRYLETKKYKMGHKLRNV